VIIVLYIHPRAHAHIIRILAQASGQVQYLTNRYRVWCIVCTWQEPFHCKFLEISCTTQSRNISQNISGNVVPPQLPMRGNDHLHLGCLRCAQPRAAEAREWPATLQEAPQEPGQLLGCCSTLLTQHTHDRGRRTVTPAWCVSPCRVSCRAPLLVPLAPPTAQRAGCTSSRTPRTHLFSEKQNRNSYDFTLRP
jgi:hypothetical protein